MQQPAFFLNAELLRNVFPPRCIMEALPVSVGERAYAAGMFRGKLLVRMRVSACSRSWR